MKSSLLLSILTIIILLGIIACRKNLINEELNPDQKSVDVNVAAAKKWYYETFKKSAEWTSYNSARTRTSNANTQKEPDWERGTYNKLGNLEITEFPLLRSNTSFSLPAASLTDEEKIKIAKASLSRIAFIKNEKNEITVREIDYIPEWQYLKKKNFDISKAMYGKPGDDFTGRIFIKNWNDDILSLRMTENGKVTKKGSIKKSTTTHNRLYRLAPGESCQPMEVCVWRQDCLEWYAEETFLYESCGSWYNTGNCWIEDYCNDGGGDNGDDNDCNTTSGSATARIEGSTSTNESTASATEPCPCEFYGTCNTCVSECESNPTFLSDNAVTGSQIESINVVDINGFKKYKTIKWYPLENLTWKLISQEEGIVELVDVSTDKWVWNSLVHKSITFKGMSPGGNVTPNQGIGTPSFVAGTPNVLYAGITLDFAVTYAPVCDDCPLIQLAIRPYTIPYTAQGGFWNAKP